MCKTHLKRDLLITPSLYSLFLYLLINDKWASSDYVLHSRIPAVIHDNLKEVGAKVYSDFVQGQNNTLLTKLMQNVLYWKYLYYSKNVVYANVYGNDEFYISMKYRNQGIKVIEDGPYYNDIQLLRSRRTKQYAGLFNYWFYWFWKDYVPFGFDKRVPAIYHTELNRLPDKIAWKGKLVRMKQLWDEKSTKDKRMLSKVFGLDDEIIDRIGKYKTILITQALPSAISELEKIEMYQSILRENGINQGVLENLDVLFLNIYNYIISLKIKTHYAEVTNYQSYFPDAMVINTPVPAQLFDVMGYEANTAITICSSAIFAFVKPHTTIIYKGTEFDERLKNHYGVLRLTDFIHNN